MQKSISMMASLIVLFLLALSGMTLASQERRPAPVTNTPQEPPQLPDCPVADLDEACTGTGTGSNHTYMEALVAAKVSCQYDLDSCVPQQDQELSANKKECETVSGCKLKYKLTYSSCDGGWKNCDPLPGTVIEDANTIYKCTIHGLYDPEKYRCDRGPALDGEIIAT